MSRSLGGVDPAVAGVAVRAVIEVPDTIGLVSLRSLAWPMAQLIAGGVRLNLMSLEALAAADHLGAEICLATSDLNPHLRAAAEQRGVPIRIVET